MASSNIEKFGSTLAGRMLKTAAAAVPTTLELGVINSNLSLSTDSLRSEIPRGDYMVNLMLTGSRETSDAGGEESGGSHSHEMPDSFHGIQAGDRVLVAWCGHEPIVIAIVVSS